MSKYIVKFKAEAICIKTIDIQDESNPYMEAEQVELKQEDFDIDIGSVSIDDLRPVRGS